MIVETITLNGETSGIIAKTKFINGVKERFVTSPDKITPRLFNNLEVAKYTAKIIIPNAKFEYFIKFKNKTVSIDSCQHLENTWEYIEGETVYIIKELHSRKTSSMGYICFENGDTTRCDKEYGIKRQKELMAIIRDELTSLLCENIKDGGLSKIKKSGKEYIISLRNTTAQIHIMYGSKLMDFNQSQKAKGAKCLPFIKDMDKFLTFYIYIDKDKSESVRLNGQEKAQTILDYMMYDFKEYNSDINPNYVPVNYNGYIILEDN